MASPESGMKTRKKHPVDASYTPEYSGPFGFTHRFNTHIRMLTLLQIYTITRRERDSYSFGLLEEEEIPVSPGLGPRLAIISYYRM